MLKKDGIERICAVESTFTNGKLYHLGDIVTFGVTDKVNDNYWRDNDAEHDGFTNNAEYKKAKEEEKKQVSVKTESVDKK